MTMANTAEFAPGFSDDEGQESAFDRSFKGSKLKSLSTKQQKSPLRYADEEDTLKSPNVKKQRVFASIFGGPSQELDAEPEKTPRTPREHVRESLSNLELNHRDDEQPQREKLFPTREPSERLTFNLTETMFRDTNEDTRRSLTPLFSSKSNKEARLIKEFEGPIEAYGLRTGIDRRVATTAIDIDRSGDYDPREEHKSQMQRSKPKRRKGKQKATQEKKPKFIVRLQMGNARGTVENIFEDSEHFWPDNHSDFDSEDERQAQKSRVAARFEPQIPIPDPRGEGKDLTGHPAARGCKVCRLHKQRCSMMVDGIYPCIECSEDNEECTPIMATDSTYRRVDLDQLLYGKERKWASCTHCRQSKRVCTLKSKTDKPPCSQCKKRKLGCTFYDIGAGCSVGKKVDTFSQWRYFKEEEVDDLMENLANQEIFHHDKSIGDLEMEDEQGQKEYMKSIWTSFAHPMRFNLDGNSDAGFEDCDFCTNPTFGMIGHFEREVHVIEWANKCGFSEVVGGHRDAGENCTSMCSVCTNSRLQINCCESHTIRPIVHQDATFEIAFDDLLSAPVGITAIQHKLQRWCSMCFDIAKSECCTIQPSIKLEGPGIASPSILEGCGLRFCDRCAYEFHYTFKDNLHEMVVAFDKMPKVREDGGHDCRGVVRADVGLLKTDGLIMAQLDAEN